uniref:Uncharacterized protein n=1 Tax=Dictyurus purpurascens TaxID=189649 RepID=A0A4D6WVD4_9FLOR|nr:hypothetical protein [Dictyurus purpurascens]
MILLHTIFENYYKHFNYLENLALSCNNCSEQKYRYSNHVNKKEFIISFIDNLNISLNKTSSKLSDENINYKFISRNFWNKFINQYWQETIFIFNSNSFSETYVNKLKTNGLSIHKGSDYKNFLISFSKALLNGQIKVLMNNKINFYDKNIVSTNFTNTKYIKYIWKKGLNWHISCLYFYYIDLKNKLLNQNLTFYYNKAQVNSLPIFAIINNHNQIVMAESSDEISFNKNLFYSLNNIFDFFLLKAKNLKKIYTGLIFINPEDAYEYKQYIQFKNFKSSRDNSLKFFIGQVNLYHNLLSYSKNQAEFRLIPDLKEVSNLITLYQYYRNVTFDKNQNYGKIYFQGQPIYIIKSIVAKNINTNKKDIINYSYKIKENYKSTEYKAVFLNYDTAILAWNKFKNDYSYYKLPDKPLIYVSNLESFLRKNNQSDQKTRFIFIPSTKTYNFVKEVKIQNEFKRKNHWQYFFSDKNIYIKTLFKRFIWSLTSRQPTNW